MPKTSDPPVGNSSPRNLLLIEDYDALVVAISSALRKFAPGHEQHVVGSINQAEKAAEDHRPDLVIIDLDPPQRGVVQFIERLRAAHPATRLLAFGCGTSRDFAEARGKDAGIYFIEKPFELPEFGKLVDELVEPTDVSHNAVADIALVDLIALQCITGIDTVLRVEAAGRRSGEIHFADGQVTHARVPGLVDLPAIEQMARWRNCRFAESERPADAPRTVHVPWAPLLIDLIRNVAPDEPPERETASTRRKRRKTDAPAGKKVVIVDDTELLLEFVEEILSTSDPTLQISTAHTGTEGVRRAELMQPDLVLLDYSLPDINGDEVCKRLLANDDTAPIPIIMMSGHLAQMAATANQYENVVATIAKPFVSKDLLDLVMQTLAEGLRKIVPKPKPAMPPLPAAQQNGESKQRRRNGGRSAEKGGPAPATMPTGTPTPAAAPPPAPPAEISSAPPPVPKFSPPPPVPEPPPPPPPPPVAAPSPPPPPAVEPSPPPPPIILAPPPPILHEPVRIPAPSVTFAPRISPISAPPPSVPVTNGRTVLLGIPLEAITMQLTPTLKIGYIRARTISRTVSLSFPPEAFEFILALQTGFDIESVAVDQAHQLQAIRLVPNRRPIELLRTSGRFNVDDVEIAPSDGLELVPSQATAMRVQMLAAFKLQSVELSPLFDVSRLVLSAVSHRVRVSLEASTEAPGSLFDLQDVRADRTGNIHEMLLSPV